MTPTTITDKLLNSDTQNSLEQKLRCFRSVRFVKHESIYNCGDKSENIYFIESGQVKISMLSPLGKECLLAIYTAGDIFGEFCLSRLGDHSEISTAMKNTLLKIIPRSEFFHLLKNDLMFESFVKYLTARISDQQQIITDLVTIDSEQRLAKVLLHLAEKLGEKTPHDLIIRHKITHEELSTMVGTTRPRVSKFMQKFRKNNLIEVNSDHFIIVKKKNLNDYLNTAV